MPKEIQFGKKKGKSILDHHKVEDIPKMVAENVAREVYTMAPGDNLAAKRILSFPSHVNVLARHFKLAGAEVDLGDAMKKSREAVEALPIPKGVEAKPAKDANK